MTLCCCFLLRSWVFLCLWNILIAHSLLFSTHCRCLNSAAICLEAVVSQRRWLVRCTGKAEIRIRAQRWYWGCWDSKAPSLLLLAPVDVCIWLMLSYQGASLCPVSISGHSDALISRLRMVEIVWLVGCSRGNLRPKGWSLTTEGSFRASPAGKKVMGK